MQIARDRVRPVCVERGQIVDRAAEILERRRRPQIAQMLAEDGVLSNGDRDRALELSAHREGRTKRLPHRDGKRREATRAAKHERAVRDQTHDRVVDGSRDRPIVDEKQIGDPAKPLQGLMAIRANRLLGAIPARRHDRKPDLAGQEMMERIRREQNAEVRVAGRHRWGEPVARPAHQHNGGFG